MERASKRRKIGRSSLRQEIIPEDDYLQGLSDIIRRDFFPSLDTHVESSPRTEPQTQTPALPDTAGSLRERYTPVGTSNAATPCVFDATPARPASIHRRDKRPASKLSLDAYQASYTSEDNSAFAEILEKNNDERRQKYAWAFNAEGAATRNAIEDKSRREQHVAAIQASIASSRDGGVTLLEGKPGKPGARPQAADIAAMPTQLLLKDSQDKQPISQSDRRASQDNQYIDWDKPLAKFDEHDRQKATQAAAQSQEGRGTWPFKAQNSLMYAPQGRPAQLAPKRGSLNHDGLQMPDYRNASSEISPAADGNASPTSSRISRAIQDNKTTHATPQVSGFSFVDALPAPQARDISTTALADLMTWGSIDATPIRSNAPALGTGGGPFHLKETSHREQLAHKMARRSAASRNVLYSAQSDFAGSPRSSRSVQDLSPAAQVLLNKTVKSNIQSRTPAKTSLSAKDITRHDTLRRQRWTPSPASSLGFDPDLA